MTKNSRLISTCNNRRRVAWRVNAILIALVAIAYCGSAARAADDLSIKSGQVSRILKMKCGRCHGVTKPEMGLDLSSIAALQRGSDSGPVFDPAKFDKGRMYQLVKSQEMPPEDEPGLTPTERSQLLKWIEVNNKQLARNAASVSLDRVLPIFQLRCTVCHGTRRKENGLDLRTRESILRGGKSGPAVVVGAPEKSLLLKRIHAGEMPPKRRLVEVSVKPMEANEVALVTRWIQQGARDHAAQVVVAPNAVRDKRLSFWAYQKPIQVRPPELVELSQDIAQAGETNAGGGSSSRNAIDRFVFRKLSQKHLQLARPANRRTLIRRLYLDMLGLLPEPHEVTRFVQDQRPDAWARLIDRVLSSPRYGERWGGYWLDLCGYSDSEGIQHADPIRPQAWRFRDYVIRAFNADKPYDRFLLEQLAGDELEDYASATQVTDALYDNLVATAFLRMSEDATFAGITSFVPDRLEVVDDVVEVLTSSVMGMTIRCARCHDHKFDPIPQADYYRLTAVFKGALDEHDWLKPTRQGGSPGTNDRYLPYVTSTERTAWQASLSQVEQEVAAFNVQREQLRQKTERGIIVQRVAALGQTLRDQLLAALDASPAKRTDQQTKLLEKHAKVVSVSREQLLQVDEFKQADAKLEQQIKQANQKKQPQPLIRALWDRGEPSPTYILKRGNYLTPGRRVKAGYPSAITEQHKNGTDGTSAINDARVNAAPTEGSSQDPANKRSGRRLAFAKWLTQRDHPLTARVMVNRIWKHHFQHGIVKSLDNFGLAGARPTHPELLDCLAVEFMSNGWSVKAMHRLMLNSATYRQVSEVSDAAQQRDPENELLSRMPLKRMDAEALRDSLIAISGRLRNTPFGKADSVSKRGDGLVTSNATDNTWRRSVFVIKRRTERLSILDTFDRPRMSPNCVERSVSTVAPQALMLLNNAMVHDLGKSTAGRVQQHNQDLESQISFIYQLTLSRSPSAIEQTTMRATAEQLKKHWSQQMPRESGDAIRLRVLTNLCHAMMNSAGFLYID